MLADLVGAGLAHTSPQPHVKLPLFGLPSPRLEASCGLALSISVCSIRCTEGLVTGHPSPKRLPGGHLSLRENVQAKALARRGAPPAQRTVYRVRCKDALLSTLEPASARPACPACRGGAEWSFDRPFSFLLCASFLPNFTRRYAETVQGIPAVRLLTRTGHERDRQNGFLACALARRARSESRQRK